VKPRAWSCAFGLVVLIAVAAPAVLAQEGTGVPASPRSGRLPPSAPLKAAREPGRAHSVQLSASLDFQSGAKLGSRSANLTPNAIGTASPFVLFATEATLGLVAGLDLRVGYACTRVLAVEAGLTYARPGVRLTVSADSESAPGFSSMAERLSDYAFDAGLRVQVRPLEFRKGRGRPFVAAGMGYLRQLHEGHAAVEHGTVYYGGAGVTYLLRARRLRVLPFLALEGLGLRGDVRMRLAAGGFTIDGRRRLFATAGGGLFAAF
jgi:hypothetical protein